MKKNKKKTIWILISIVILIGINYHYFWKKMIIDAITTTGQEVEYSGPNKYICPDEKTEVEDLSDCK